MKEILWNNYERKYWDSNSKLRKLCLELGLGLRLVSNFVPRAIFKIVYLKIALAMPNMAIYFSSGKYELSICSFLEYCYHTIISVQHTLCPSKWCLVHDWNVHMIFSALNLTIICIKPFTLNNTTFSVSFLHEILFLH